MVREGGAMMSSEGEGAIIATWHRDKLRRRRRRGIGSRPSPALGIVGRCRGGEGEGVSEAVAPTDSGTIAMVLCGDNAHTYLFLVE